MSELFEEETGGAGTRPMYPWLPATAGARVMVILILLGIVAAVWGPTHYLKIAHGLAKSPDRSSLLTGVWVGRVAATEDSPEKWAMPAEGSGNRVVMLESERDYGTVLDGTRGRVSVCSSSRAQETADYTWGYLKDGEADLEVSGKSGGADLELTFVSPRDGKLLFSGVGLHNELRGILHRSQVGDFETMCKGLDNFMTELR